MHVTHHHTSPSHPSGIHTHHLLLHTCVCRDVHQVLLSLLWSQRRDVLSRVQYNNVWIRCLSLTIPRIFCRANVGERGEWVKYLAKVSACAYTTTYVCTHRHTLAYIHMHTHIHLHTYMYIVRQGSFNSATARIGVSTQEN